MRILVTGGTGDLGGRLVPRLEKAGHDVVVGTRTPSADDHLRYELREPPPSLDDFDVVVHLATESLQPEVDLEGATRLWEAAAAANVSYVVYMSIVGVDDHAFPYYRAKAEAERRLTESGVPFTILRATQFHRLIPRFVDEIAARAFFVPVPAGVSLQPIDADVVAERLEDLVGQGPSGRVDDLAGPEVLSLDEMVDDYLAALGTGRRRIRVAAWGQAVRDFRDGKQLARPIDSGGETYTEYLATVPVRRPDPVAASLRIVSAAFFAIMVWMLVSPANFHANLAGFGDFNSHFIRDTGTFILPLAIVLWLAASHSSWRVPVLVTALIHNGLHLVNHIVDVANTDPAWQGPGNLAALAVLQIALWRMFAVARTSNR